MHAEWFECAEFRELMPVLERLNSRERAMDRALLLQVIASLNPWIFGSGVNLYAYSDSGKTPRESEAAQSDPLTDCADLTSDWFALWVEAAEPGWLVAFMDILIDPPHQWELSREEFCLLFLKVAGKYPDESMQMLRLMLDDSKFRPRTEAFLKELAESVDWL